MTYPSGLVLTYGCTSLGYAQVIGPGSLAYWRATGRRPASVEKLLHGGRWDGTPPQR